MRKVFFLLSILLLLAGNVYAVTSAQLYSIFNKLPRGNTQLIITTHPKVYAETNGKQIFVNFKESRSWSTHEAAWILGHELGHQKDMWYMSPHNREYSSDYYGAVYARNAGYSPCKGVQVMKRWEQRSSWSHPHPAARLKRICGG